MTTPRTRARGHTLSARTTSHNSSDRNATLRSLAAAPGSEVLARLDTQVDGLSPIAVTLRRARVGTNAIAQDRPAPWWVQFAQAFVNPFIGILVVLAVISALTEDAVAAVIITVMVIVSAVLRFVQEYRSLRAAASLQAMVSTRASVRRPDYTTAEEAPRSSIAGFLELPLADLVPGDIVHLSAGDMLPADVRLLEAKDLFVNQAPLTGESLPVEKDAGAASAHVADNTMPVTDLATLGFLGTSVVSGSAIAVVVATGDRTQLGGLARAVVTQDRTPTAFDAGIRRVSLLLIRFMLVMVPVVMLVNGFLKGDWLDALLFGLAVAVGLTPEMLPMIVSANLAKGAVAMSRRRTIVKRLDAIQNMGAMDVLCCDKTGTLTEDRIVLERHVDATGREDDAVLAMAWLNSAHQTGLRNLLDSAVLEHAERHEPPLVDRSVEKVDEIPWDFARRRMSVVVRRPNGEHELICKGAVDEVLSVCTHQMRGTVPCEWTATDLESARTVADSMQADGMRLVAVAYRPVTARRDAYSVADEHALCFVGFIGFLDPPKASAAEAVRALGAYGVAVKVLTGDSPLVARTVCRAVGIDAARIVAGPELATVEEHALARLVAEVHVFAKLTPQDKERIVRALRASGQTVGFLGDGINDAPALRAADVGISVDTATDIARESASVILLDKDLLVLEDAIVEGRRTFANIMKYLKMTASSNFGNVFSVLVASAFLPFLPMLPIHLLTQNLLYDLSQISIPWDAVDAEYLEQPRQWRADDIGRFMLAIGPISSIFDILTFVLMWHVFKANAPEHQALFQSGWFVVGLLTQTLIVHMIRTEKVPFVQSIASRPVLVLTATVMAVGILVPFSALGRAIGLVPLPLSYFPWLVALLLGYATLTQMLKALYIRRFCRWL